MVLAAGAGRRLRPDTDELPKTLLPVAGETTILDIALRNLAAVGLSDVVVVVGHAAQRDRRPGGRPGGRARGRARARAQRPGPGVEQRLLALAARASTSPAASCWSTATPCIRSAWRRRCWPPAAGDGRGPCIIAVDDVKPLAEEEMKVVLDDRGLLTQDHQADGPGAAPTGSTSAPRSSSRGRRCRWPTRWRPPGGATPGCTTRTATRSSPTAAARSPRRRSATRRLGRGRQPQRPAPGPGDRRCTVSCWPGHC